MYIDSIILNNFRVYKSENIINFPQTSNKNIFLIAGDNGFGKTTLLTSIVWCLYGKQMIDVDDKFKHEIADAFGYKNYAKANLNNTLLKLSNNFKLSDEEKNRILKSGYPIHNPDLEIFKNLNEYSVTLIFSQLYIPSVPCEQVTIKRTYDVFREKEYLNILIDGKENELTKEFGAEIFINDFVLSKDIAKFFFFDSEKIVALAEMKSVEEKRKLSIAYSEVLGVKKYEDLKNNLENLRVKFRKKSSDLVEKNKLETLIKDVKELKKLTDHLKEKLITNDAEILNKRQISETYQEKLIREGNALSISELITLKNLREELKTKDIEIKNKLKDLLELAPFAIAGKKFVEAINQMQNEKLSSNVGSNNKELKLKLKDVKNKLLNNIHITKIDNDIKSIFLEIVNKSFEKQIIERTENNQKSKTLLDFTVIEQNEFQTIFDNIKFSYNHIFKQLVKDDKNNKIFLGKTTRKISQAESNDNDILIKEIRNAKSKIEKQIIDLEKDSRKISEEIGSYQRELSTKTKLLNELSKKVSLDESDILKDKIALRVITELNDFLLKLKSEKKSSLEINIRYELNKLMHKADFINKVKVDILGDLIEIHLFDKEENEINKDKLSKGEQQLYATAILKALVDESEIKFPIFIDSPLQKFDKKHSKKIITEFYPNVSEQVIIFPLLEKELTEEEYNVIFPYIRSTYIIRNNSICSKFQEVKPKELFEKIEDFRECA
jgi:DNA sulfur modification protein DndD